MANKKEERAARNNRKGRNAWRNAGKPAKAGNRKIYLGGKRKTKNFQPSPGFMMKDLVGEGKIVSVPLPSSVSLRNTLEFIQKLEYTEGKGNSDPFVFDRMRAHARAGIIKVQDNKLV